MPMDQYAAFVTLLPDIEAILKENGQSVPRPNYVDAKGQSDEGDENKCESDSNIEDPASPKKNIEATSDEDQDDDDDEGGSDK